MPRSGSVSYTHLDVYKRQANSSAILDIRLEDEIVPEILTPGDGAIGCWVEGLNNTFLDGGRKGEEDERHKNYWHEEDPITEESDEDSKQEEGDPGNTSVGEEECEREESEEGEEKETLAFFLGQCEEIGAGEGDLRHEEKTEHIRMTEGAEDTWDRDVLVVEADIEDKLENAEEDREQSGDEDSKKESPKIADIVDAHVGKKSNDEKVKDTNQFIHG